MDAKRRYEQQKVFWEHAGEIGYGEAQFSSQLVEHHIITKQWNAVIETAKILGLGEDSKILELGCGDGKFSEHVLATHFKSIDAFDVSEAGIKRAQSLSKSGKVSYGVQDLTKYEYEAEAHWDGLIMLGFLHHVKGFAPDIVSRVARVCPKVVVLEPNGNNIIRKMLERLPSYQRAGEDSFKRQELLQLFGAHNYTLKTFSRITFMPTFLPQSLLSSFRILEKMIE